LEAVLATYEDDAYTHEPSGGKYVYRGKEQLREIYTSQFSNEGGIGLEHCTITDDSVRCAIEYNCVRWGSPILRRRWASRCTSAGAVGCSQQRAFLTTTPLLPSPKRPPYRADSGEHPFHVLG
jgi:hypothetical protein